MAKHSPDRQVLENAFSRRAALRRLGVALAAVPLAKLFGCSSDSPASTDGPDSAVDDGDAGSPDASLPPDGGAQWASGGTAVMSGDYPDPFGALPAVCALACATTLGPCYSGAIERRDISEGYPGLPVRLAFRVVDETCSPIEGAVVDIWHTRNSGLYSGTVDFCTSNDADAESHLYFRGAQTTDANGRVDFDSCFPGWYPGRAVHIHFQIRIGAAEFVTSQLYFDEAVKADIFATHPDYVSFGFPNRTNAMDGIFPIARPEDAIFEWTRQTDGSMLASKTLVVRASLASPLCAA